MKSLFGKVFHLILLLVATIASTNSVAAEQLNFVFMDATGRSYQSSRLADGLGLQGWSPDEIEGVKVLLIETPSLSDKRYLRQMTLLDSAGIAYDDKVLYVVACTEKEFRFGYHTSKQVARVLNNSAVIFRVRLLDEHGTVIRCSTSPVSVEIMRKWLREKSLPQNRPRGSRCSHLAKEKSRQNNNQ
jgi:hypothetical protein